MPMRFLLLSMCLLVASCAVGRAPVDRSAVDRTEQVELAPGLWIDREAGRVGFRAWVCLDAGWLEQVVCGPGTREHESLMVTNVPASGIHAALLLLGLEPGSPGRWVEEGEAVLEIPPEGPGVFVDVQWTGVDGVVRNSGISKWIRDVSDRRAYPTDRWVFAGSIELDDRAAEQAGARYLADRSGSVIGLVTFGDELLAASDVIPDAVDVHAPEWVAATGALPPVGTEVTVVLATRPVAQTASE